MHGKRKSNGNDGSKSVEFDLYRSSGAKTFATENFVATMMRIESFLPEMPMIATYVETSKTETEQKIRYRLR